MRLSTLLLENICQIKGVVSVNVISLEDGWKLFERFGSDEDSGRLGRAASNGPYFWESILQHGRTVSSETRTKVIWLPPLTAVHSGDCMLAVLRKIFGSNWCVATLFRVSLSDVSHGMLSSANSATAKDEEQGASEKGGFMNSWVTLSTPSPEHHALPPGAFEKMEEAAVLLESSFGAEMMSSQQSSRSSSSSKRKVEGVDHRLF